MGSLGNRRLEGFRETTRFRGGRLGRGAQGREEGNVRAPGKGGLRTGATETSYGLRYRRTREAHPSLHLSIAEVPRSAGRLVNAARGSYAPLLPFWLSSRPRPSMPLGPAPARFDAPPPAQAPPPRPRPRPSASRLPPPRPYRLPRIQKETNLRLVLAAIVKRL